MYDDDPLCAGPAMVIILLLASLNSCTNPWIYMVYSDSICGYLLAKLRGRPVDKRGRFQRTSTWDSSVRFKSSVRTELTRMDSYRGGVDIPLVQLDPERDARVNPGGVSARNRQL